MFGKSRHSPKPPTQGPYGLKKCHDPENALVDVIFVHGLTGNHVNTWTDRSTGVFWPEHLLKNDIPEARILSFGYDADIVHFWSEASQNCIGNHAQNLLNSLCQLRLRSDSEDRPLMFVAHSLGGLVVEDVLLTSKNGAEIHLQQLFINTVGVAFLGTPHCGSDLARWAKTFGNFTNIFRNTNTRLLETLKPESEVLARIQKDFQTMIRARHMSGENNLKICCFYEELPVKGVGQIVPMHSAILPAYNAIGIRNNHMDMTKFVSQEDPGYLAVSTELFRWTKDIKGRSQVMGNLGHSESHVSSGWNQQRRNYLQMPQTQIPYDNSQSFRFQSHGTNPYPSQSQHGMFNGNNVAWHGDQYGIAPDPGMQYRFQSPQQDMRPYQGGNRIEGQTHVNQGKIVQGNNIHSDRDVTFNF